MRFRFTMENLPSIENRLSEDDVARQLGVSRMTVIRLRNRRAIGYIRIGGRVFYTPDHVKEYLASAEHRREV